MCVFVLFVCFLFWFFFVLVFLETLTPAINKTHTDAGEMALKGFLLSTADHAVHKEPEKSSSTAATWK